MKNLKNTPKLIESIDEISKYGKFHFTYLGYEFKEISSGKIYSKGLFWDLFRDIALILIDQPFIYDDDYKPKTPVGFEIVKFDLNKHYIESGKKIKISELQLMYNNLIMKRKGLQ